MYNFLLGLFNGIPLGALIMLFVQIYNDLMKEEDD